jgi:ribosomal protein RSM22 (predicted rRNA methylase)
MLEEFQEIVVKTVLGEKALEQFYAGKIENQFLKPWVPKIMELSNYYNKDRNSTFRFTSNHAKAYALYYAPINFTKTNWILNRIRENIPKKSSLSVLDYGCGPGTASLALSGYLDTKLDFTCIDLVRRLLLINRIILFFLML